MSLTLFKRIFFSKFHQASIQLLLFFLDVFFSSSSINLINKIHETVLSLIPEVNDSPFNELLSLLITNTVRNMNVNGLNGVSMLFL